jgi:hypothetical protein
MHAADLAAARCLVVRCSRQDRELVLVPLRVKTGGPSLFSTNPDVIRIAA